MAMKGKASAPKAQPMKKNQGKAATQTKQPMKKATKAKKAMTALQVQNQQPQATYYSSFSALLFLLSVKFSGTGATNIRPGSKTLVHVAAIFVGIRTRVGTFVTDSCFLFVTPGHQNPRQPSGVRVDESPARHHERRRARDVDAHARVASALVAPHRARSSALSIGCG